MMYPISRNLSRINTILTRYVRKKHVGESCIHKENVGRHGYFN